MINVAEFHGDPVFLELTEDELKLFSEKSGDYAHIGDSMGNFNRVSAILALYPGLKPSDPRVVALNYMLKQLDAAMSMMANDYEGKIETLDKRLRDVHVYAKIIRIINRRTKNVSG